MHDAHAQKVRARRRDAVLRVLDPGLPDDVAVAVRLEDVGAAQRRHPVDQHAARGAIDDAVPQPPLMTVAAGDQVAAIVDEEIGPLLEPVVVDAIGVGGAQIADPQPQRRVVH